MFRFLSKKKVENDIDWKKADDQIIIVGTATRSVSCLERHEIKEDDLEDFLNKNYKDNYLIFNFSHNKINNSLFHRRVLDIKLEYISLDMIFRVLYCIEYWNHNPNHYSMF